VVAKADPGRLGTWAQERGWRNVRLLSSQHNTIHHRWVGELTFACGDNSPLDPIWSIWGVLDLTPGGRGETAAYPSLQHE
jgi:predicted dithiol-disulfide oxidoreductase (DUF899 family)